MKANANIHKLYGEDIAESLEDSAYAEYRRQWQECPEKFIVSEAPLFLDIEACTFCNLRCQHCIQTIGLQEFQISNLMDWDLYERAIDEASDIGVYGCKYHAIGRGEPLLHPDIARMVAYAKKKGLIDVYLNTNGMVLTQNLSKRLLDAGLDRISFSVNGHYPEIYERHQVGGNFSKLFHNIDRFLCERDEGGYRTKVRVQTVVLPGIDLDAYANFWSLLADEVDYIDYKEMSRRKMGIVDSWSCPQLWQRMSVLWDGTLLPCNHDDRLYAALGRFPDVGIDKAWRSMKFLRRMHQEGNAHLIAACDGCFLRTASIGEGGDTNGRSSRRA